MRQPSKSDLIALSVTALALSALDVTLYSAGQRSSGWAGPQAWLVLQLVLDLSLLVVWRFPRTVFGLVVAGALAMLAADLFAPGLLSPVDPLTLATVPTITPVLVVAMIRILARPVALTLVGLLAVVATRPWAPSWDVLPFGLVNTVLPALLILYVDARKQLLQSLRDRAERAEREQSLLAEQARAQERRRLAAEMHDVVTHQLSLMVLHAGALGVSSAEASVRAAAEDIRAAGTRALDELRDLVGVLRTNQSEMDRKGEERVDAAADIAALEVLAAESASVGVVVRLDLDGDPALLSPTISRTAHRIVQEALTNVRKHAPGAVVDAELRYGGDGVRIRVRNGPAAARPDPVLAESGSGAGLAGLRQRADLLGGSLRAGPVTGGGFELGAILPAYVPTAESSRDDPGSRRR
ncbi:sensor histidine kinase [Amycolatopsis sp. 195334CR]|uniref:sensor histidine kinase n=1 Tax=Amycolatopsis sp. 195334CR TaxID=2814588 RepID=UPI001A8F6D07|nr:histidine kinase [Amycolatopsis sp. 195334CR]MBN6037855.1 two-component sensor histidine kinase [Amycolatopsis sp. 195334CR]